MASNCYTQDYTSSHKARTVRSWTPLFPLLRGEKARVTSRSALWPQDHLRTAELGDRFGRALRHNHRVPDLRGAALVQGPCRALDDAVARRAQEVALQLDGREARGTFGKRPHSTVAAAGVRQRDHRAGVQE